VEFIIKELGDFTRTINQIKPGTRAWLEAPHGHLTHIGHEDAPGIALIAGGVGIAPLLGILRELAVTGDPRPTVLLYGNRTVAQIVCREELQRLSESHGTEVVHVLSEPPDGWRCDTGMIDETLLRRHFETEARRDWLYILCGPPEMLKDVEATLISVGVPSSRILSENFVYG
jgi:NAD(P)H-flavin reductase